MTDRYVKLGEAKMADVETLDVKRANTLTEHFISQDTYHYWTMEYFRRLMGVLYRNENPLLLLLDMEITKLGGEVDPIKPNPRIKFSEMWDKLQPERFVVGKSLSTARGYDPRKEMYYRGLAGKTVDIMIKVGTEQGSK